jgi:hypothetical protein
MLSAILLRTLVLKKFLKNSPIFTEYNTIDIFIKIRYN